MKEFDVKRFAALLQAGHGGRLGIVYHDHDGAAPEPWVELALPYAADQIGDPVRGVIASGPIVTLMDMATSMAVWAKRGRFAPHATLDLRIDYLRAATPGRTVIGRGDCYRLTRSVAFVRGQAHDGDPADPIAHVAGTFMLLDAAA
ncbi:phenylacetic acid degradation protein [Sphingomonas sp. Leaf339]|uniref:PaaI family thioesterase n=1 Tax=Sphingomonas sp. Leaf339 TaxID=1736343 RepID=UPI0006F9EE60|nr:PaaI family thioesterase [Sphingomonas sp. Leaf339]KQU61689.1 phenylacetic acid degradation protein [Sphingomonas sp. Leaf339]